ncbi:SAM-dependent methyltransferase [Solimonas sp. K1W22B-7]|uniref:class I SAM-dependent methyltransferase n=1 Tax=Solimonas sp. K1W22B-7 TaxID=2303331 RepID=UPI000E333B01|nr:class I SAM-dependent methyltransferase [Solimonas sp. K1W22B-7]AXQ28846.1 SAM-dependent methyltransferase [Solimonas sp. K1W22B-7]
MTTQAKDLAENINRFYDAAMFSDRLINYYGGSDYTNFGYWTDATPDAKAACDALMAQLLGFIPEKKGRILDVACGKGETSRYLSTFYPAGQITAINISERQLSRGREIVPGANFMLMDATALEFPDASFDAVVCVEAAFHFNTREKFLREAARVLKPGGHLVLSDILTSRRADEDHQRRIGDNHVADLDEYRALYAGAGLAVDALVDATENCWRGHYRHMVNYAHEALLHRQVTRSQLQQSLDIYYERAQYIEHYLLVSAIRR